MYLQIMSHYLQNTHMQSLLQKKRQDYRRKKRSVRLRTEQHRKQRAHLRQPLQALHSHKAQIPPYRIHQAHLQQDHAFVDRTAATYKLCRTVCRKSICIWWDKPYKRNGLFRICNVCIRTFWCQPSTQLKCFKKCRIWRQHIKHAAG